MIHILVVEDDAKLNQLVCTYLNDCGFETKGCLRAKAAYDEMYNNLYDLIISDIMMPEVDGFEFARTVRQVNKHIPTGRDCHPAAGLHSGGCGGNSVRHGLRHGRVNAGAHL